MTEQPTPTTLVRDDASGRLYPGIVDARGFTINRQAWATARASGGIVGVCRGCGNGHLKVLPAPPPSHTRGVPIMWDEAQCTACGKVVAIPAGRVLKSSSAAGEQPFVWRESRIGMLRAG